MTTFEKNLHQKIQRFGINYTLNPFLDTLKRWQNPQNALKNIIHVAGTNGKGSTVAFLSAMLQSLGYSVATYTSPHLFSYTERIQINATPITENDFQRLYTQIQAKSPTQSEFETLTLLTFLYFKEKQPDYILLECGLGGRLDATNVIESPILTLITRIDFDHSDILGNTLDKIAQEKAGIIKKNCPLICLKQTNTVQTILKKQAQDKNAPYTEVSALNNLPENLTLNATYQKENLALAQSAIDTLFKETPLTPKQKSAVTSAIKNATNPARFSQVSLKNNTLIIDAAHNPNAITALINTVKTQLPNIQPSIICGFLKSKDAPQLLSQLFENFNDIYYCKFNETAWPFLTLKKHFPQLKPWVHSPNFTLPKNKENIYVITGSIHFIGSISQLKKPLYHNTTHES